MSARLPSHVRAYKRTPSFTEKTVPAGLLGEHSTKDGTWGLIRVEEGELRYTVTDPRRQATPELLSPSGEPGLVEPTIVHRVEACGPVRFHVEFFRAG